MTRGLGAIEGAVTGGAGAVELPKSPGDDRIVIHGVEPVIGVARNDDKGPLFSTDERVVMNFVGRGHGWSQGRFLSLSEREEISRGLAAGLGVRAIARAAIAAAWLTADR
mgnify:CR=1 FL=1